MNARLASLLTALLFLATPLALVPSAQAQAEPVTDCFAMPAGPGCALNDLEGVADCNPVSPGPDCPFPPTTGAAISCIEPAALESDPLWSSLCKVAEALGAEETGVDADQDGRDDIALETNTGAYLQLDYFFTDSNAGSNDEVYAINPMASFKVRVDPFLYSPADGSRLDDDDTVGDFEYYLTNQHTYTAPDGVDAGSAPDQNAYTIALIVVIPASNDDAGTIDGGLTLWAGAEGIHTGTTQCVACVDVLHARIAFGAHYYKSDAVGLMGFVLDPPYYYDGADENVIDVDVAASGVSIEDSILEKSDTTTLLYIRVNDRYNLEEDFFNIFEPTKYPDGTFLNVQEVHIKDVTDPDWKVNFHFRSDLDDDGWVDYLELDCGSNPTGASNCNDFDGDTLTNAQEDGDFYPEIAGTQSTDPYDVDSDNDKQWDAVDPDPLALRDFDSDGLNNDVDNCPLVRNTANGGDQDNQNPGLGNTASPHYQRNNWGGPAGDRCEDTDGDGIKDYKEDDNEPFGTVNASPAPGVCGAWGDSSPILTDTDGDGLLDAEEDTSKDGNAHLDTGSGNPNDCDWTRTDPNRADTDGDGVQDKVEKTGSYTWNGYGAHPGVLNPLIRNEDGDGLDAAAELVGTYNSYCKVASGPSIRVDASATDDCTAPNPTNPKSADTDGDRSSDSQEQLKTGPVFGPTAQQTDPIAGAFDTFDTDPTRADTDNDGFGDRY